MKAKHPGSWTCTICGEVTRFGEWQKCKHGPVKQPVLEMGDVWRHLRIMALAAVDKEAAAIESARWLLEAVGRPDLLSALGKR